MKSPSNPSPRRNVECKAIDPDPSQEHALIQMLRERLRITDELLIAAGYAEQLRSLNASN